MDLGEWLRWLGGWGEVAGLGGADLCEWLGGCGARLAVLEDSGRKEEAPAAAVAVAPGGLDLGECGMQGCIIFTWMQAATVVA